MDPGTDPARYRRDFDPAALHALFAPQSAPAPQLDAPPFAFGTLPDAYAHFRPPSSDALITELVQRTPFRRFAVDIATGDGKLAAQLAPYFESVLGADDDPRMIKVAPKISNVRFEVSPADRLTVTTGCVDLVTVRNAIHWFDTRVFWKEMERVLRPGGMLAVINTSEPVFGPFINAAVRTEYHPLFEEYLRSVQGAQHYKSGEVIDAKFARRADRTMFNKEYFTLDEYLGLLETNGPAIWYQQTRGKSLTGQLRAALLPWWTNPETRRPGTIRENVQFWERSA